MSSPISYADFVKQLEESQAVKIGEPILPAWCPLKETSALSTKPQIPNKMAAIDIRWQSKVAYTSKELVERQKALETYNPEIAMMFDCIRLEMTRILKKSVTNSDLDFYVNFGSPISNNKQNISVVLNKPISLDITLLRSLTDNDITWAVSIAARPDTQLLNPVSIPTVTSIDTGSEIKERKQRKIKL